jgi:cell division protein FtsL
MIKKRRNNKNIRLKLYFFISISAIVLFLSLGMYQKFKIDLIMQDIHRLEQHKKQLLSETELLRSEVDILRNIDRISKIAKTELHMINNNDPVVVLKVTNFEEFENTKSKIVQKEEAKKKLKMAGVQ